MLSATVRLRGGRHHPLPLFEKQVPYAGGGKGRPRPLHPRPGTPRGYPAPWNPNLMLIYAKRLARMPMGREGTGSDIGLFWHTKGMRRWIDRASIISCRGLGGRLARPAG